MKWQCEYRAGTRALAECWHDCHSTLLVWLLFLGRELMLSFILNVKLCNAASSVPVVPKHITIQLYIKLLIWLKMSPAARGQRTQEHPVINFQSCFMLLKKEKKKVWSKLKAGAHQDWALMLTWFFPHLCFTSSSVVWKGSSQEEAEHQKHCLAMGRWHKKSQSSTEVELCSMYLEKEVLLLQH